ncbi:hypothetical protein ACQCVP_03350 [Rossellomorea vietnamensis]
MYHFTRKPDEIQKDWIATESRTLLKSIRGGVFAPGAKFVPVEIGSVRRQQK